MNNPTLALSPRLQAAKGFACVLENHRKPTINVCAWCDPLHETDVIAKEEGWLVSHGICVPHYQEQMVKMGLD